jgi:hypothetical protein
MIKNQSLGAGLLAFSLLAIMYSFGTFGFLNLFGIRTIVQVLILGLVASLMIALQPRYKSKELLPVLAFFYLYVFGSLIHDKTVTGLGDPVILLFVIHVILSAPARQVLFLTKTLVVVTSFLCLLVATAYVYYRINPDQFDYANFFIYGSEIGTRKIYPGHFMDWVSFTSGDGFMFQGESTPRMKGYSNEPSSTVVHYLAPAVFAFLLGGRFIYFGIFILFVNFIAIASFIGYLIFAISFMILVVFRISRRHIQYVGPVAIILFISLLTQIELMKNIFEYVSMHAIDQLGLDIVGRKIRVDSLTGSTNLNERQSGMIEGLGLILSSPLGYSTARLGPGAGLLYIVSSFTGWLGVAVFGRFIFRIINNCRIIIIKTSSLRVTYSVALLFAVLFVTLFVSGYGWGRPPGMIMLLLFFRVFQSSIVNQYLLESQPTGKYTRKRFKGITRPCTTH